MTPRYVRPSWFTTPVWNRLIGLATRRGLSSYGSRLLAVRGRASGAWRTTPVNVLVYKGDRYLVAPRRVTQWVRNIRTNSEGELRRWHFEVGAFSQGIGPNAPDKEMRCIAPDYPVFRIHR